MPGSCCGSEHSDSSRSTSTSEWSCTGTVYFHGDPANIDAGAPALGKIDRDYFLGFDSENSDVETDGMMRFSVQCGSQQPYAESTPKNNDDAEQRESAGMMVPPDSSSPVGLAGDSESSPSSTCLAPLMPLREDVTTGRLLSCPLRDGGQSRAKALFNDRANSNAFIFPATTSVYRSHSPLATSELQTQKVLNRANMDTSLHGQDRPTDSSQSHSRSVCTADRGSLNEHPCAINERQVGASMTDVCAMSTRTAIEQTRILDKTEEVNGGSTLRTHIPISRKRALLSGPAMLELAMPTESEPPPLCGIENHWRRSHDVTIVSKRNGNGALPSKMPACRVLAGPAQAELHRRLKRHCSSVEDPPEAKKLKLDRTASRVSCTGELSAQPKYQTKELASIRRAQSLRSEVSECSSESTHSQFYPSPLSSPTSQSCADKDYPPTVPSTPLPTSVDYARSKANPMARTIPFYRHRSLNIPRIPSVPIIAPPRDLAPTVVRCSEDYAIDRLKALLLRECSERSRDGLNSFDEQRTERLKAIYATYPAFSRRDSASTSDSSDSLGQWEEESTRSTTESQGSQNSVPNATTPSALYRMASRQVWSNAYGITNVFRIEITGWILKKLPKEPVPCEQHSDNTRCPGFELHDQLKRSPHTRFHAAQLFHRYFLLPDKVEFWREARKHECLEQESCESDEVDWKHGVWDLAVACLALSVKLHRDVFRPLGPILSAEYREMAPYSMTHDAFELAQRDILYTFQFMLGSCTPQDVLDELWLASPALRRATVPIQNGWEVVQRVTWDKLFESLLEPDMLQYPVSLLTAAALINGLTCALVRHFRTETEANVCERKVPPTPLDSECVSYGIEPTSSQIYLFEATELVDVVILDVRDVLELSDMELDECRTWMSCVGK